MRALFRPTTKERKESMTKVLVITPESEYKMQEATMLGTMVWEVLGDNGIKFEYDDVRKHASGFYVATLGRDNDSVVSKKRNLNTEALFSDGLIYYGDMIVAISDDDDEFRDIESENIDDIRDMVNEHKIRELGI